MISLIQRVTHARVSVDGETVGAIAAGLLALVAIEPADGERQISRMLDRLFGYRVFADAQGRMNRSLADADGGLLLVPQFTLCADTAKGMRPSFAGSAQPDQAQRRFEALVTLACGRCPRVATGRFGAHMQVELCNDGPATFWLVAR